MDLRTILIGRLEAVAALAMKSGCDEAFNQDYQALLVEITQTLAEMRTLAAQQARWLMGRAHQQSRLN